MVICENPIIGINNKDFKTQKKLVTNNNVLVGQIPSYNKKITLVWGRSKLTKSKLNFRYTKNEQQNHVIYTVRAGEKVGEKWWSEAIDLAALYKQAWPKENQINAKIIFLGVIASKSEYPATINLKNLKLSN